MAQWLEHLLPQCEDQCPDPQNSCKCCMNGVVHLWGQPCREETRHPQSKCLTRLNTPVKDFPSRCSPTLLTKGESHTCIYVQVYVHVYACACIYIDACVCICVCTCMYMCVCVHVEARGPGLVTFRQDLSMNLELTDSSRLANQQVVRHPLVFASSTWGLQTHTSSF